MARTGDDLWGTTMARGISIAVTTALLLLSGVGTALACDTSSWLLLGGSAYPGGLAPLRGGGFDAGGVVLVWDRSGGRVVGEADVGSDGRVETEVRVPADAAGAHKIIALPQTEEAGESPAHPHAWTDVFVATAGGEAATLSAAPDDAGTTVSQRSWVAVAIGGLVAGLLLFARRRRSRRVDVDDPCGLAPADLDETPRVFVAASGRDADLAAPSDHDAADDLVMTASR